MDVRTYELMLRDLGYIDRRSKQILRWSNELAEAAAGIRPLSSVRKPIPWWRPDGGWMSGSGLPVDNGSRDKSTQGPRSHIYRFLPASKR